MRAYWHGLDYWIFSAVLLYCSCWSWNINPCRRFSGHAKHWLSVNYKYKANFYANGFVQHLHLEYWRHWFGIRSYLTKHWLDWDQWVRKYYCHSLIFMKWIGERNMHFYIWWCFAEAFKHFFLLIMWSAGWSTNLPSGLFFFVVTAVALGFCIYLIVDALNWVILNRINTFQNKKQIFKDIIRYLVSPEFPPSKFPSENKVCHKKGIYLVKISNFISHK